VRFALNLPFNWKFGELFEFVVLQRTEELDLD